MHRVHSEMLFLVESNALLFHVISVAYARFRCCEHSSYVFLLILTNERSTLCSTLVGGGMDVTWKASIRYHILPCITTMGLLAQHSNLVPDYDRDEIYSEAEQYMSTLGLRSFFLFLVSVNIRIRMIQWNPNRIRIHLFCLLLMFIIVASVFL